MYCSLQEAWPTFKTNITEHFIDDKPPIEQKKINCDDILNHIKNCDYCKNHLKLNKNPLTEIFSINPQIKDTIIVFLFGLILLLIVNLFFGS